VTIITQQCPISAPGNQASATSVWPFWLANIKLCFILMCVGAPGSQASATSVWPFWLTHIEAV
jgi:hypothetical protein